ncbi:MAG: hypothetical protein Q8R98_23485 [Rubrivivax sp.]|nr:hypothetical protein [Rubrivivax sp.]MDP3614814.1 hypothetical protein [Rubrivivax sp.]
MSQPAYMQERWFSLLQAACKPPAVKAEVAQRLGVSAPLLYQVLNGSGLYGSGKASTRRLADKVLHQLGSYTCPHLSEQHNEERVITSDQCRNYAHRPAPTASPRDLAHWQACRKCPHRTAAAPAVQRPVVPRKGKDEAADQVGQLPTPPAPTTPPDEETAP